MRACISGCSPALLFQLVHDPVPQNNSHMFNCLKLDDIKTMKKCLEARENSQKKKNETKKKSENTKKKSERLQQKLNTSYNM